MRTIEEILLENDALKIKTLLCATKRPFRTRLEDVLNQYDPEKHKVMDEHYRKKKKIKVPTERKNPETGATIYQTKYVDRCRCAIPVQRVIVERAVGFLFANDVKYKINDWQEINEADAVQQKALFDGVMKIFHNNKVKYFDKKLARALFSERECAELWYMPLNSDGKPEGDIRVKLLSPTLGDKLYPHFDDYDRMDGFGREYKVYDEEHKIINHFDIYTKDYVYCFDDTGGSIRLNGTPKQHGFGKIPVIYYRQEEAEWAIVQSEIERMEDLLSNWGDANDYFGTPKYFVKGKLAGFAEKGEQGQVFVGEGNDPDMKVLSWDNSPTSVANELANLNNVIFSYTQSADISFENMKTLGSNTSGVAIKLMFSDPHMKAMSKIELFGEMFTRRCNLIKSGYGVTIAGIPERIIEEAEIEPIFTPYAPKDEFEEIRIINASTGNRPTMSQEEGVKQNPRIKNPKQVLEQLKVEQQQSMLAEAFGASEGM